MTAKAARGSSPKPSHSADVPKTATGLRIKVHSPYKTYFDEEATSISAVNSTGPFDILPRHHNFLTLLSPCELVIHTAMAGERHIRIARGVMHVQSNNVTVFLDV